ncbi:MAG: exosortase A [Alteromonadaceae bacterium]|jgi:exosortase A
MDLSATRRLLPLFGVIILLFSVSLLNVPIIETLWRHGFDDGTYSHAYLIPFISLYLYYQLSRDGQLNFRDNLSIPFALFLVISCYLLFITTNAQISIGYWFSFLLVCTSSILMLYRWNWRVAFPAAFLIFILPFWGVLVPLLQNLSVIAVTYIMSFTGIPTYVEAQTITIPAGVFEIAGGCSGLRYLLVSLAISSMFIFLYINNMKKAAIFFIVSILGALITNWIRITLLIIIGEYTDMQSSLMADHNMFGWYLYIPFMFMLFKWGERLISAESSTTEKINRAENNKANRTVLFVTIAAITISSTSLKTLFSPSIDNQQYKQSLADNLQPNISFYSSVENIPATTADNHTIYDVYSFDSQNLDNKATYFGNTLIPTGWKILDKTITGNWQTYILKMHTQRAMLKISYEINGEQFALPRLFKINRLIKGMTSLGKSKLHWKFQMCSEKCEVIKTN